MASEFELIEDLRAMLSDDDPSKNILNNREEMYSDTKLKLFLKMALRDINAGSPRSTYTFDTLPDADLAVIGAMIFIYISEGTLQLRNQVSYNDAGLSLNLFDKTGLYQGWASFLLQSYMAGKADLKRGVTASSYGAGFLGIRSEFSSDWGCSQ